jgi:hypothetical protein
MLVGKPEGKRPLGRPRCRWLYYIKMDLRKREDGMVWIGLMWLRIGRAFMNTVMNLRVPLNAGKFLSSCTIGGF